MTAWEEIIKKQGHMLKLQEEINLLKEKAVLELRKLNYSHDRICKLLGVAKITSIRFAKSKDDVKSN